MSRKFFILAIIVGVVTLHIMTGDVSRLKKELDKASSEVENISLEYSKILSQRNIELLYGKDVLDALKGLPVANVKVSENVIYFSPKNESNIAYKISNNIRIYKDVLGENCLISKLNPLQFKVYVSW